MIMSKHKQPVYSKSSNKSFARKTNMQIKQIVTNRRSIKKDRSCWTLCNEQDESAGSEINQYLVTGFIHSPSQLFGVDNDQTIIEKNERTHPEANWIHDDWYHAIRSRIFNPEFVYLDTLLCLNNPAAARMLVDTMMLCPDKTVIVANFCANNPRCGKIGSDLFEKTILLENMKKEIHPVSLRKWNIDKNFEFPCISYLYVTSKTIMRSYIFYKGVIDSNKIIEKISALNY